MMNHNHIKRVTIVSLALFICSFASADKYDKKLYKPSPTDITRFATLQELKAGRETYINRCTKCHGLVSPDRYNMNDWTFIISKMSPRAHLTPTEANTLYKYVTRGK